MAATSTRTLEFIFDFVSPNAYLAWWPVKEIVARTGATLEVTPVFLGGMHRLTGNAPPFQRDAGVKGKNEYAMLEMGRFIAKHGLAKFAMHPQFPFNSVTLQRMLLAVEGERRVELVEALLPAIWERGVPLDDPAALGAVLADAGFDAAELLAATQDHAIKQRLIDNTEHAVERGTFGIPTFYVGSEMFFGKERLGQIEEELAARG
jgi:2-hydroxychromene-2-carboxylate isomerase